VNPLEQAGAIVLVLLPFVVSPGTSFGLTLGHVMRGDRQAPLLISAGTAAGITAMAAALSLSGVGPLIARTPHATSVIGVAGSIVLAFLGLRIILTEVRPTQRPAAGIRAAQPCRLITSAFLALVLNPKALSVYLLVVPGVTAFARSPAMTYLVFGAIHIVLMSVWLLLVGWTAMHVPGVAASTCSKRILTLGAGVCLVAAAGHMFVGATAQ
jgi:threonine/homoserine/homoserine lactone efflux protein